MGGRGPPVPGGLVWGGGGKKGGLGHGPSQGCNRQLRRVTFVQVRHVPDAAERRLRPDVLDQTLFGSDGLDGAVAEYQAGAAAGGGGGSRGDRQRASESATNEVLDNVVGGVVGGARDLSSFSSDDDNDARTMAGLLSQAQDEPPIFERSGPSSQAPPAWAQGGTGSGGPRVQEPEARNAAPRRHLLVSHYLARALDNAWTAEARGQWAPPPQAAPGPQPGAVGTGSEAEALRFKTPPLSVQGDGAGGGGSLLGGDASLLGGCRRPAATTRGLLRKTRPWAFRGPCSA